MTDNRALWELVDAKFRSGNSIPVERIVITRAEYEAILELPVVVSDEMLERASWASCLRCCEGDEDAAREEWTKYAENYWEDAKVMLSAALESMVRGKS